MATHARDLLAWRSHGQKSMVGYSAMGSQELDTTEQLTHTHKMGYAERNEGKALETQYKQVF